MTDSSWFSLRRFTVALGTIALGTAAGIELVAFPVVGAVGHYLGIMMGGFAAGLAFEHRPMLESGVAGLVAGIGYHVVSAIIGGGGIVGAIIGLLTMAPQVLLLAAVLSFGLAALGAHFGNDFREGLTQPVDDPTGPSER